MILLLRSIPREQLTNQVHASGHDSHYLSRNLRWMHSSESYLIEGRQMPKNIVIYSDGTGQDGGVRVEQRVSNVYKLYRASRVHPENRIDPNEQVCFYDPGLGTDSGAGGLTGAMRWINKL